MTKPRAVPLIDIPEPCTHAKRENQKICDDCEQRRLDASIERAGKALRRMESPG